MLNALPPQQLLTLTDVHAPLALCNGDGKVVSWTEPAGKLLGELQVVERLPGPLHRSLWSELEHKPPGEALEWRLPQDSERLLGCTRYRARGGFMLVLKEISNQRAALSQLLQRQRLEVTGRLVASIAHELRNSVASVIYNAQLVQLMIERGNSGEVRDAAENIQTASEHLEETVKGLLEYAKATPNTVTSVNVENVVNRACGFLRALFREGAHRVEFSADTDALWIQGNTIAIEQILVNLMLNAAEAADAVSERIVVSIRASRERLPGASPDDAPLVRIQVSDDGPGIPSHLRQLIFHPFFSTSAKGTGLGLTNARDSLQQLGGSLVLEPSERGACFSAYFPKGEPRA